MPLAASGRVILDRPIEDQLAKLEEQLETRIQEVNTWIETDANDHIRITRHPRSSEPVNHPIVDDLPQVNLSHVLTFADAGCQMLELLQRPAVDPGVG